MHRLKKTIILGMALIAIFLFVFRSYFAVADLIEQDQTRFLAFPLTVILPGSAFAFLASRGNMASQEGVLMQLGAMIQILLIIAVPRFALHLALGFPIVFLIVELFETKMPTSIKSPIKSMLMT